MKLRAKDKIFLGLLGIGLVLFVIQKFFSSNGNTSLELADLRVGDEEFQVELAQTDEERYNGLSGRDLNSLEANGMLFIHTETGKHSYVMREMKFDLDFFFIKGDKIVDVARNVAYEYSGTIQGAVEYDKVLEIPAGWLGNHRIQIGDEVKMKH